MTATATHPTAIDFNYEESGEVLCRNPKGLIFFLFAPVPAAPEAAPAPAAEGRDRPGGKPFHKVGKPGFGKKGGKGSKPFKKWGKGPDARPRKPKG